MPPGTPPPLAPPPARRKSRWLLFGCLGCLVLLLLIIASVAITIWWIQRPIKPVVLSLPEKAVVEQKLRQLEDAPTAAADRKTGAPSRAAPAPPEPGRPSDRTYVPGSKVLRLTDREINGLLNANTDLGNSVRLEFARDAINAFLAVRIPDDSPLGGGKMFRARGRFRLSLGNGGEPYAVLEDVSVLGVSLPKAWLGGLKGENLIGKAVGERNGSPILRGIKSLRVEPGALVLELEE